MAKKYLGELPPGDPLHGFLRYEIQPQLNGSTGPVRYRVFELDGSNDVYLYEEKRSGAKVIGKFFLSARQPDREAAARRLEREYHHLELIRGYGLTGWPHYIARPLGRNAGLNQLLVVEHCDGELLSDIIIRSIRDRDDGRLFYKLTALGYFLATFHNRTANDYRVDFNETCDYTDRLIRRLVELRAVGRDEAGELYWLRDRWREQPKMRQDRQVLVHGDATPGNFMFGDGLSVISFDLERVRRADRVYDAGRIAGELMHFFLRATGNKYAAEPFIGHFLWEYACHFPDREPAFRSIAGRVPFYMGITLLRIARNEWFSPEYRRQLIEEAKQCLRRFQ
jgi:aminoglycoside phosphotransferase (APT) family kinase protein